jgi:glycosyltransferase involved in cell wall biosynthesis
MMTEPTPPDLLLAPLPTEARELGSVIWVGRLLPRKGIALAIEVMSRLPLGFTLIIVGDGPQRSVAEEAISTHGLSDRVTITGMIPWTDVVSHLDRAQVMLFTSIRDTIGTQLFEAAARGVPIVGIQHQGVGDYIPSTAGRLVPLDTPEALTSSLARAIGHVVAPDVWGSLSRGARQLAERYSPEGCATDLEREYQRFLGPETPTGAASSAFRHRTEGRS